VGQKVVFLRKLVPGGSNHSFGIHVARIAGMPPAIVERAQVILKTLEEKHIEQEDSASKVPVTEDLKQKVKGIGSLVQLQIFDVDEYTRQIKEELLALDLNKMTPIDALWKLNELVKIAGRKNSG
jgi:DNA mismatch repair protein MutS